MRLTNEMRNDFADDVMESIKVKSKWNKDSITAEVERRLMAWWPKEVHDFEAIYPGMIQRSSLIIEFLTEPDKDWGNRYARANVFVGSKLANIKTDDLQKRWEGYLKEMGEREAMKSRLLEVAYSVNTNTALAEVFPKLVKFIPKDAPKLVKMHPVVQKGLVDDLIKMGLEISE